MITEQEKTIESLKKLGELMGVDSDRIDKIFETKHTFGSTDEKSQVENLKVDLTKYDKVEEKHKKLLEYMEKTKVHFNNSDVVEISEDLINMDVLELMWSNINLYTYDIKNLFLNKFVFYVKDKSLETKDNVNYKAYFSIENDQIFLLVEDGFGRDLVGGAIAISDDKFVPVGAVEDELYEILKRNHIKEGLPFDRQFVADRTLLNFLLYILVTNEMVNKNKEVITETSKRVNLPSKKSKNGKKKKQPKRTVSIRYIKVDGEKIRKINEERERQQRESYERHVDEWTRRGHYRTYKSGKKIWIKPSVAKAQTKVGEKIPKIYKIK